MRIKDFQLLSLRLICKEILRNTPYFRSGAQEEKQSSSKSLQRSNTSNLRVTTELDGLYVPGETVSLNLSCEQAVQLIYTKHNPGAYKFGQEMVRAVTGFTLVSEAKSGLRQNAEVEESSTSRRSSRRSKRPSTTQSLPKRSSSPTYSKRPDRTSLFAVFGRRNSRSNARRGTLSTSRSSNRGDDLKLLLYLNRKTWMGNDGVQLAEIVRAAWAADMEICMVHESDPAHGGCEFGHLFQTTPVRTVPRTFSMSSQYLRPTPTPS